MLDLLVWFVLGRGAVLVRFAVADQCKGVRAGAMQMAGCVWCAVALGERIERAWVAKQAKLQC